MPNEKPTYEALARRCHAAEAALAAMRSGDIAPLDETRAIPLSESVLQRLFDILPVGLWFADKDGKLIRANREGVAIWGGEPHTPIEEYGVFKARRLPSGEEIAADDWALAHTIRDGDTIVNELIEIDAFDGTKRIILNSTAPILDENGSMLGAVIVNHEITDRIQAQEALRASEAKLRSLFAAMEDIVVVLDSEGRYVEIVPTATNLLYRPPEHLLGKSVTELFPEELSSRFKACIREVLETGSRRTLDYQIEIAGQALWFSVNVTPYTDDRVLGVAHNITAQKQAEESLRDSEAKYRFLAEHTLDAIWVMDLDLTFSYISEGVQLITGYRPEEWVDTPLSDHCDPEHFAEMARQVAENLAKGAESRGVIFETEILHKDGTPVPVEIHGKVLYDDAGVPLRLQGTTRDISARKQAEEEMRFQARVLDQIQDRITVTDLEGRITYVNDAECRMLGLPREAIIGQSISMYGEDPAMGATQEEILRETIEKGEWRGEVVNYSADGSAITLYCRTAVVRNTQGEPVALCGIATDITERKEIVAALLESEQKYRILVENANSVILRMDHQGNVTFFNPFSERFFGYMEEEIIGRNVIGTIVPERESTGRDLADMLQGILHNPDEYRQNENENRRKDGSRVWVNWTNKGIQDQDGNLIEILCIGNDITARKHAEKEMQKEKEFSQLLLDTSPAFIVAIDNEGKVLMMNKSLLDTLGYSDEDVFGTDYLRDYVPEQDRKALQAVFKRLINTQETTVNENRIISRSGQIYSVEWHGRPVIRPDASVDFFVGVGTDISARKKAEEALRYRVEIETFMAEVSVRFINVPPDKLDSTIKETLRRIGIITGADRSYLFLVDDQRQVINNTHEWCAPGISPQQPILQDIPYSAMPWWMDQLLSLNPIHIPEVAALPLEAETTKALLEEQGVLSLFVVPISWQQTLIGFLGFDAVRELRDWTMEDQRALMTLANTFALVFERKRADEARESAESQLRQAQKMEAVGRLAGGIAHDFNNMLGVILGHTEMALLGLEPDHPLCNSLLEIQKAGERSANLTRQLLAFARKQTISPREIDLNDTIAGMLKMLGRLIGENIDLLWMPGYDVWPVKMDPVQVDQILANLIVNARDAITSVGKITIETDNAIFDEEYCLLHTGFMPGEFTMLAISDNGCGMDRETLASLFEPFFTTKPKGQGTGLGLATVYGIVKQNQGFINVYSEAGHGSIFKIYIPKCLPSESTREEKPMTLPVQSGTETILLVEDEAAMLDLAKRLIEQLGYRVLPANSPSVARRWAQEYPAHIDLLLTDVVMPEMNGRDLWQELIVLRPGLKCLFMSGYTENAIAHHGVLEEGVLFLAKPFSLESLASRLREALSGE